MKKQFYTCLALSACFAYANADITVNFKNGVPEQEIVVTQISIDNLLNARRQADIVMQSDTIALNNNSATFKQLSDAPSNYAISLPHSGMMAIEFFAQGGENLTIDVNGNPPETYTYFVSGTPLMEGISQMQNESRTFELKINELQAQGADQETLEKVFSDYQNLFSEYVKNNPDNPASAYALLNIPDDAFLQLFPTLGPNAQQSILYPMVAKAKTKIEKRVEATRKQEEMQSGNVDAPDFTLPDLAGKSVSLSDFKGKWVILDFWGAWCKWCIKGFPELKEAYNKYKDRLEVIGIDCGDTPDQWKAAVERFSIPWVNVYNNTETEQAGRPDQTYGIQGFPTKIIISPEGKIKRIVTGEDPEFYTILADYLK